MICGYIVVWHTITDIASKLPATFFTLSVESSKTICMTTVYKIKR